MTTPATPAPRAVTQRKTYAKEGLSEEGVGSIPCYPAWESDPTEYGAFARLDVADDGRVFLSITDMEEHDGSYVSVQISDEQFTGLQRAATEVEAALDAAAHPPAPAGDAVERGAMKLFEDMAYIEGEAGPAWRAISEMARERWRQPIRAALAAAGAEREN